MLWLEENNLQARPGITLLMFTNIKVCRRILGARQIPGASAQLLETHLSPARGAQGDSLVPPHE